MQPDMIQPNNYRIDEAKYKSLLKYIRLSVTEKYEFPQEIVQIDGVTIATIGNFSASTGKPKSKKTFNVSAIVASALSGKEILKYKAELQKGKDFLKGRKNPAYEEYAISKMHKALQRRKQTGR